MKKVIVITGVTGSGKSELGISLAKKYNGEIINADSVSIYKHLNIGSAKINESEMQGIPHHLNDKLELNQEYDVAQFQKESRQLIDEIHSRNKMPIIVGGSGLYINAVVYDYQFPNLELKPLPENLTNATMHQMLAEIDKEAAEKIHINNTKRLERALQIALTYGKQKSELNGSAKERPYYDSIILFLGGDRTNLYHKINTRVERMFDQGLVEEVSQLYDKDSRFFDYSSTNAIGYREFKEYFLGNTDLESVKSTIKRNTRRFAKRQETWFRNQTTGHIIDITDDGHKERIEKLISDFLKD